MRLDLSPGDSTWAGRGGMGEGIGNKSTEGKIQSLLTSGAPGRPACGAAPMARVQHRGRTA